MKVQDFFEGMSRVAATVNVVTTNGAAGQGGITVSAMTSVSADPPTLLICIHDDSPTCDLIKSNRSFCVNVLHEHQAELSEFFAGRLPFDEDTFLLSDRWEASASGSLMLVDALVSFDCVVTQYMKVGTHTIFYGEIESSEYMDGKPLIYVNREYT